MKKIQDSKSKIQKYKVVAGIEHDHLKVRYEPGAVVELDVTVWPVAGLVACGAIAPVVEVEDGNGQD